MVHTDAITDTHRHTHRLRLTVYVETYRARQQKLSGSKIIESPNHLRCCRVSRQVKRINLSIFIIQMETMNNLCCCRVSWQLLRQLFASSHQREIRRVAPPKQSTALSPSESCSMTASTKPEERKRYA